MQGRGASDIRRRIPPLTRSASFRRHATTADLSVETKREVKRGTSVESVTSNPTSPKSPLSSTGLSSIMTSPPSSRTPFTPTTPASPFTPPPANSKDVSSSSMRNPRHRPTASAPAAMLPNHEWLMSDDHSEASDDEGSSKFTFPWESCDQVKTSTLRRVHLGKTLYRFQIPIIVCFLSTLLCFRFLYYFSAPLLLLRSHQPVAHSHLLLLLLLLLLLPSLLFSHDHVHTSNCLVPLFKHGASRSKAGSDRVLGST